MVAETGRDWASLIVSNGPNGERHASHASLRVFFVFCYYCLTGVAIVRRPRLWNVVCALFAVCPVCRPSFGSRFIRVGLYRSYMPPARNPYLQLHDWKALLVVPESRRLRKKDADVLEEAGKIMEEKVDYGAGRPQRVLEPRLQDRPGPKLTVTAQCRKSIADTRSDAEQNAALQGPDLGIGY